MEPADRKTLIVASAAFITITSGVLFGIIAVNREPATRDWLDAGLGMEDPRRFTIDWSDGGPPEGNVQCVWTTAVVSDQPMQGTAPDGATLELPSALQAYGARWDAGPQYAYARVCDLMPGDGGPSDEDEMPTLEPGIAAMEFAQMKETYDGGPRMRAILQGEPGWPCACRAGDDCEWSPWYAGGEWMQAPLNMTLTEGQWRGADCFPKTCNEAAGYSSWPEACPTQ